MRIRSIAVVAVVTVAVLAGCSSSDDSGSKSSSTSTTAAKAQKLTILVGNDDGYSADGIDAVVEALRKLPDVDVTVSAPAENKTGTGSSTTPGTVTATQQTTKSGYPAYAVNGFPADGISYGLSQMKEKPDLVVTGINEGPNLGPVTDVSGTVGAAKAAAARGIPAIAASQGVVDGRADYSDAAQYVVDWVTAHRSQLLAGSAAAMVVNVNVPTCTTGGPRGVKQVPLAPSGNGNPTVDCASTATDVADDIAAFSVGFVPVSQLDAQGQTVTSSTTWPAQG